jgi:hypothetical protein
MYVSGYVCLILSSTDAGNNLSRTVQLSSADNLCAVNWALGIIIIIIIIMLLQLTR